MNRGISMLPEDRKDGGLFMDFNIVSNIAAASLAAFARSALFSNSGMRDMAEKHLRDLRIAAPDIDREVRNLSGGNQKKVMLTEWLARIPRVLLVDKPTRDTVDLSRRIAARLRRRRHQLRLRLDCLPADADSRHLLAFLVHGGHCRRLRPFGREDTLLPATYCIGGNAQAAMLSSINVDHTVFGFFVIMGLLSGHAGAHFASRLNTALGVGGSGCRAEGRHRRGAGGASLSGGKGTISGAFLGMLLIALLQNAMIVAGINRFWRLIVVGFDSEAGLGFVGAVTESGKSGKIIVTSYEAGRDFMNSIKDGTSS